MSIPWAIGEHDIDWGDLLSQLDERGFVSIPGVLTKQSCEAIALNSQTKCNTCWIRCCHGTKL